MFKKCNSCNEMKPLTEFFKDKGFKDGYYSRCKVCKTKATLEHRAKKKESYNEYMRTYRKKHPDTEANKARDRRKSLRLRYGITEGEYNEMLIEQGGTCALCQGTPVDRPLHVDHDHKTGRVRGLLCASHNRSIAVLDDERLLKAAMIYLGLTLEDLKAKFEK